MGHRNIVILVVEDEASHRMIIRKTLQHHNVSNPVHEVENGKEALDYVYGVGEYADRSKHPKPDLILLDIKMPVLDGFEVLQKLKADPKTRHIPVVMLTTSTRDEEIAKGYSAGANAYITKPVEFSDFSEKLKNLKVFWTLTAEIPPRLEE